MISYPLFFIHETTLHTARCQFSQFVRNVFESYSNFQIQMYNARGDPPGEPKILIFVASRVPLSRVPG